MNLNKQTDIKCQHYPCNYIYKLNNYIYICSTILISSTHNYMKKTDVKSSNLQKAVCRWGTWAELLLYYPTQVAIWSLRYMHNCSWQNAMLTEVVLPGNCHPCRIFRFHLDSPEQANFSIGCEWQIGLKDMSDNFWPKFFNSNCRLTVILWTIHYYSASEKIQLSNYWTRMTYCLKWPQVSKVYKTATASQNWGWGFKNSLEVILSNPCCSSKVTYSSLPRWLLNISKDSEATSSQGNLWKYTFSQQKVFHDVHRKHDLLCLSLCPLPLVLSLGSKEVSLAACLLYTLLSGICRLW